MHADRLLGIKLPSAGPLSEPTRMVAKSWVQVPTPCSTDRLHRASLDSAAIAPADVHVRPRC